MPGNDRGHFGDDEREVAFFPFVNLCGERLMSQNTPAARKPCGATMSHVFA